MHKPKPTVVPQLNPEGSLGYVINRLARDYARVVGREIGKLGVRPAYMPVLLALWEREGKSQAELATIADIEQPTMAATLARMHRDGLITKEPDPNDRRASLVILTEHARNLREPVTRAAMAVNAHSIKTLKTITPTELMEALQEITEAIRRPIEHI